MSDHDEYSVYIGGQPPLELTATNTKLPLWVNLPYSHSVFSLNDHTHLPIPHTTQDVCSSNKRSCGSDYFQVSVIHEPPSWAQVRSSSLRRERIANPRTIFFWAPLAKWGLVAAGLKDFSRPAEKLSVSQNVALAATGFIWVSPV